MTINAFLYCYCYSRIPIAIVALTLLFPYCFCFSCFSTMENQFVGWVGKQDTVGEAEQELRRGVQVLFLILLSRYKNNNNKFNLLIPGYLSLRRFELRQFQRCFVFLPILYKYSNSNKGLTIIGRKAFHFRLFYFYVLMILFASYIFFYFCFYFLVTCSRVYFLILLLVSFFHGTPVITIEIQNFQNVQQYARRTASVYRIALGPAAHPDL